MMRVLWGLASASLAAWIVLILGWGLFWRVAPRLSCSRSGTTHRGPSVAAVIPARDEADVLPETLPTVLRQDYEGEFHVLLVDDRSGDGTGAVARATAERGGMAERLTVISGEPLPHGWSGKVWAMSQGAAAAGRPEFLWFTDADIDHEPWILRALVEKAQTERLDLVSVMATLRIASAWDRLLVPAFVYFFAKLYPFRFVGNERRRKAGAAGGCILVRRDALEQAGGFGKIRSALIDDCALARLIKRAGGRLWLGFSRGVRSLRGYGTLSSLWEMVARSAYTQLHHSLWMLAATVAGMVFLYLLPPGACLGGALAAALGAGGAVSLAALGATAWGLMAASFVPIVRHHGVRRWVALLLPAAGALYTAMTISSAWRYARGRDGAWKGRTY